MKKQEKEFICEKCGRRFKQQDHLNKHLNRVNACDECGNSFNSSSILKRHLSRKSPCTVEKILVVKNEENKCHLCDKTFSSIYITASSKDRL